MLRYFEVSYSSWTLIVLPVCYSVTSLHKPCSWKMLSALSHAEGATVSSQVHAFAGLIEFQTLRCLSYEFLGDSDLPISVETQIQLSSES